MFGRKPKRDEWMWQALRLRRKGKLSDKYAALLQYFSCTSYDNKYCDDGGHYDYFAIESFGGHTPESIAALRWILPAGFLENFNGAREAYDALGEDPEFEAVEAALDKYDDYMMENSDEIADILKAYIADITARKI